MLSNGKTNKARRCLEGNSHQGHPNRMPAFLGRAGERPRLAKGAGRPAQPSGPLSETIHGKLWPTEHTMAIYNPS